MRIVHIIPSLNPRYGGPSSSLPVLLGAQRKAGIDLGVIVSDSYSPASGPQCARVGPMSWIPMASNPPLSGDLFHVNALWNATSSLSMRYLRRHRKPYVITLRGMLRPETIWYLRKRTWAMLWEKGNVANAAAVHVTSQDELDAAIDCGWHLPPVALIPHAIVAEEYDRPQYRASECMAMPPVVLFVGRLSRIKRIDLLIRAYAVVRRIISRVSLLIVGPDHEGIQHELEGLARQLNVGCGVRFAGMKSSAELTGIFSVSTVFAMVSERENFGLAAAEAMAAGVPSVLTNKVGIALEAARAGAAIIPCDDSVEAIAHALTELLSDDTKRREMGENGARFIRRECSPEAVAAQMIDVYKWVLGQGPRPDCVRLD